MATSTKPRLNNWIHKYIISSSSASTFSYSNFFGALKYLLRSTLNAKLVSDLSAEIFYCAAERSPMTPDIPHFEKFLKLKITTQVVVILN